MDKLSKLIRWIGYGLQSLAGGILLGILALGALAQLAVRKLKELFQPDPPDDQPKPYR